MQINKSEMERLKKEVMGLMWKIDKYTQTINALMKLGWTYNSEMVSHCHNERAFLLQQIEQKTDYEWLPKIWNNGKGKCVVYDRKAYLEKRKNAIVLKHYN